MIKETRPSLQHIIDWWNLVSGLASLGFCFYFIWFPLDYAKQQFIGLVYGWIISGWFSNWYSLDGAYSQALNINLKTHLRQPNLKQPKSESTTYSVWNDNQFYYLVFVSSSGAIVIFTILRAVLYAYSGLIQNKQSRILTTQNCQNSTFCKS